MIHKTNYRLILIILSIGIVVIGMVFWLQPFTKPKQKASTDKAHTIQLFKPDQSISYDSVWLQRLQLLSNKLSQAKQITYGGYISMINPTDTAKNFNHLPFIYIRNQDKSYFKVGQAEIFNAYGQNVFVDHELKRISVSAQKEHKGPMLFDIEQLSHQLHQGDYRLKIKPIGKNIAISMLNEGNLDCKECTITYDTTKMQIVGLYARIPEKTDPFVRKKEKTIRIDITNYQEQGFVKPEFINGKVLYKQGTRWKTNAKYATYELIQ